LGDEPIRPPTQIDVFVDYMCPYCRRFERDNGAEIQELVDRNVTGLVMHPVAILDRMSRGGLYSTRSAAAAYAVAAGSPEHFGAFNQALFTHQPREGSSGLSEAELAELAQQIGIERAVTRTFADNSFLETATRNTQAAIARGLQGTPTVLLSGRHQAPVLWEGERSLSDALSSMAAS
jgi:protein-disulfide isomerase